MVGSKSAQTRLRGGDNNTIDKIHVHPTTYFQATWLEKSCMAFCSYHL